MVDRPQVAVDDCWPNLVLDHLGITRYPVNRLRMLHPTVVHWVVDDLRLGTDCDVPEVRVLWWEVVDCCHRNLGRGEWSLPDRLGLVCWHHDWNSPDTSHLINNQLLILLAPTLYVLTHI